MTPDQTAPAISGNDGPKTPEAATLEGLFADLESPLHGYALKLTQRPEIAQDLVQEAFMRLHARFNDVRQPRLWLYRTVHNLAMNHHRAEKKIVAVDFQSEGEENVATVDLDATPDEQLQRSEAIERARLGVAGLDERARELIRLKFDEGMSYKEMSARTGLSVSYVGNLLHHAIHQLAEEIERDGGL
mgnify:FL=1|jgi:RNA polymerase sigma-70 factor (ECF subfamily)